MWEAKQNYSRNKISGTNEKERQIQKNINKSPKNNKERKFIKSEDESDTDSEVKQKPKAIKKQKYSKENEE